MWVFGYGSLIWKVDFPFEEKLTGCVKGFSRRFYQQSIDHRGVPDKPGRVVTLIQSDEDDEVWGVAYRIAEENVDQVVHHLDHREKNGYERFNVYFYPQSTLVRPFELTIYLATTENSQYAGEAPLDEIALQVVDTEGPSGTNAEYVFNLAKAMREIAPHIVDEHLFTLEEKVIDLLERRAHNAQLEEKNPSLVQEQSEIKEEKK